MLNVVLLLAGFTGVCSAAFNIASTCRHTESYFPDECVSDPQWSTAFKYTCLSNNRIARTIYSTSDNPCTSQTAYEVYSDDLGGRAFTCDSSKPKCPTISLKRTYYEGPNCVTPTGETSEENLVYHTCVYHQGRYQAFNCEYGRLMLLYSYESCADIGIKPYVYANADRNTCYTQRSYHKLEFNCSMWPPTVAPTTTTTVAPLSAADCRHTGQHLAGQCYYEPNSGWDAFKYQCLSNSSIALDTFSGGTCKTRFPAVGTLVSHSEYTDPLDGMHFMCDSSKPECPTLYFKQMYYTANCRTLTDSSERPVVYDRCVYADGTYMFYTCFSEDVLHKYYSATSCVDAMGGSPEVYVKDTCIQSHIKYDFDCTATTTAAP